MYLDLDHRRRDHSGRHRSIFLLNAGILLVCLLVYLLNRLILKQVFTWPIIHHYLNDFLAAPILCAYTNILFGILGKHQFAFQSLPIVLLFVFLAGIYWEFIAPLYVTNAVADVWDLAAYLTGGFLYWVVIRTLG